MNKFDVDFEHNIFLDFLKPKFEKDFGWGKFDFHFENRFGANFGGSDLNSINLMRTSYKKTIILPTFPTRLFTN